MISAPKLAIEWSSPWAEFVSSIGPAMRRAPKGPEPIRSGARARSGLLGILAETIVCAAALQILQEISLHHPTPSAPAVSKYVEYEVSFNVQPMLPSINDADGAEIGTKGKSGGSASQHEQVIRVAREGSTSWAVSTIPPVLPVRKGPVANLVALTRTPAAMPKLAEVITPARELERVKDVSAPRVAVSSSLPNMVIAKAALPSLAEPLAVVPEQERVLAPHLPVMAGKLPTIVETAVDAIPQLAPQQKSSAAGKGGGTGNSNTAGLAGVVLTSNPGDTPGIPMNAGGVISMGPGGSTSGLGVGLGGGGTGIARGSGTGSGSDGNGPGGGSRGSGPGNSPNAKGGISVGFGPGGSGGNSTTRGGGITVVGNVITLPSFGPPQAPAGMNKTAEVPSSQPFDLVVVSTSRAGSALHRYMPPTVGRIYTVYLRVHGDHAVMEFTDPDAGKTFDADLTPPSPLVTTVPQDLSLARTVISAVMSPVGELQEVHVLDAKAPELAARLAKAVRSWRFRPAFRGREAVAVKVWLGFGIGTD